MTTALFIGRFQPFHKAHLKDIKTILKKKKKIIIGIGSSQYSNTKENPFTFEERVKMIDAALKDEDISQYKIFPIPDINNHSKWVEHVKSLVPEFDVIFTRNPLTEELFKKAGFKVERLKEVKDISATKIREKIIKGEKWEELLPKAVSKYLKEINGIERIKK